MSASAPSLPPSCLLAPRHRARRPPPSLSRPYPAYARHATSTPGRLGISYYARRRGRAPEDWESKLPSTKQDVTVYAVLEPSEICIPTSRANNAKAEAPSTSHYLISDTVALHERRGCSQYANLIDGLNAGSAKGCRERLSGGRDHDWLF
ncbi:hypothetical protein K523DRAFT_422154 [Schizophyllum commune Tattone D]|nr:hypothetical protein K523DRAFT_422154 [Schizophyllum commune Tattone D]